MASPVDPLQCVQFAQGSILRKCQTNCFCKSVEESPVAAWPLRAAQDGGKNIRNIMYVTSFEISAADNPHAICDASRQIYKHAVELYEEEKYAEYWAKLRELPFHIVWSDGVDLQDAVFQFLVRQTAEQRKYEVIVCYFQFPYLSHSEVRKIVPNLNCMIQMPEGVTDGKLASRFVQAFLANAGGDCYFMRELHRPLGKEDTKASKGEIIAQINVEVVG